MMDREISAGIIIYRATEEGARFLLLYSGGRYWNFPKGKIDGESSFAAAIREVHEETGLGGDDLRFEQWFKVRDQFVYMRDKRKIFKTVSYYLAETKKADIRIPIKEGTVGESHHGYGWFLYRDALRMLIHETLRRNLRRANDAVTKGRAAVEKERGSAREQERPRVQNNRYRKPYRKEPVKNSQPPAPQIEKK